MHQRRRRCHPSLLASTAAATAPGCVATVATTAVPGRADSRTPATATATVETATALIRWNEANSAT